MICSIFEETIRGRKVMSVISKSAVMEKLNQREAEAVLNRIKTLCEEM